MAVTSSAWRSSSTLFRSRSLSCPEIVVPVLKRSLSDPTTQPVRQLNVMLLNPKAPKIRHLNTAHSLMIEMEKHVKKVQELEHKVYELEMQLQLRELVKTHKVINQAWQSEKQREDRKPKHAVSEEEQKAFGERLAEAKRKAEQLSMKRARQEADILRSWKMKKLENVIDQMSKVPESEIALLPCPSQSQISEQDLACHASILHGLENLVNIAHDSEPSDEVDKLRDLMEEKDNLTRLLEDIDAKMRQADITIEDCKKALYNVNAARTELNANLTMSNTLLDKMETVKRRRETNNIFVFGPNPIFSLKETELAYSVSNQFVVKMLQELDISGIVAERNLKSSLDCREKYKENQNQIGESLQLIQETINMQVEKVASNKANIGEVKKKEVNAEFVMQVNEHRPEEVGKTI